MRAGEPRSEHRGRARRDARRRRRGGRQSRRARRRALLQRSHGSLTRGGRETDVSILRGGFSHRTSARNVGHDSIWRKVRRLRRRRQRPAPGGRLSRSEHRSRRRRRWTRVLQLLHVSRRSNRPYVHGGGRAVHQRHEFQQKIEQVGEQRIGEHDHRTRREAVRGRRLRTVVWGFIPASHRTRGGDNGRRQTRRPRADGGGFFERNRLERVDAPVEFVQTRGDAGTVARVVPARSDEGDSGIARAFR